MKSKILYTHIKENQLGIVLIIVSGVLHSLVTFLLPVSIGEFFNLNFHSNSSKAKLFGWLGIRLETITQFFIFFFILLLVKFIASFIEKWFTARQSEWLAKTIREKLFAVQINWPNEIFKEKSYGNYLLRYSNDMKAIQDLFTQGLLGVTRDVLFVFTGLFLLFKINNYLAIWLAAFFICMLGTVYLFSGKQKKYISNSRNMRSNMLAFVAKSFTRHFAIKQNNTEEKIIDRFAEKSNQLLEANLKNKLFESLLYNFIPVLQFVAIAGLLCLMAINTEGLNSGDALIIIMIVLMLQSTFRRILKTPGIINKGKISLLKTDELLLKDTCEDIFLQNAKIVKKQERVGV
jgi:ABC-type multidrug transport system fused ATPase/permease subunit